MHNYRSLLKQNFNEIAELISTENGKTIIEARGDIQRGFEVVEYACGIAEHQKGESLSQVAENIDGITVREPIGVCAGISPFNFPAMVPMWMFPIAIACGNTFVLKPSEKVPLTAVRLVELLQEAGLPDGVMNLVHGGKEVVETLCTHPDISAISFVGSSTIAKYVYKLGSSNGKRVQAGGAAKNALVVMPDADPDSTLRAVMSASFGCAGQRCMAGSLLIGVGEIAKPLKEKLIDAMNNLKVGDPLLDPNINMGPVIDKVSQDRITSIIDNVSKEVNLERDGRDLLKNEGFFVGPTLFSNVLPDTSIFKQEVFGPVLSMMNPKDLSQAISWINQLNYGNGSSIFTQSGAAAKEFKSKIKCGMIGINVGVPAPMSMFPFSGWNDSFYGDLHMQ
jgi:malonate-semialdehyde dehydrogenase (acetylating)/methylmalonate-semialdehyde dehydrogenase